MPAGERDELAAIFEQLLDSPGNADLWAVFFRRTWPFVLVQARGYLGRATALADAEDVAQNVYRQLSAAVHDRQLQPPRDDTQLFALLRVITRHEALDALRADRAARRDVRRQGTLDDAIGQADPNSSPQQRLEASDLVERLLARLTAFDREVLQLLVAGHTADEIAQRLQTSPKTIYRHYRFIRDLLASSDAEGG
jgi:RNA polymerase sigma factor (sigma-70 family)